MQLPASAGYVIGAVIFLLAGLTLGAIAVYAWWENRSSGDD